MVSLGGVGHRELCGGFLGLNISEEVLVPEGDEAKDLHKKKLVMVKRIIADSIKDHLIPQVSSLKTPKEIFYSLTKLFEGKNINRKMTLRNQSYFRRFSQIKEQIEAVKEEVKNAEVVIATLNGLPGSWDSFMQRMYSIRK